MKSCLVAIATFLAALPALAQDKIGFIYVGPVDDYGYNIRMDVGRKYLV